MPRISNGKATEFKLYAPQAKKVSIAGSFNSWDSKKFSAKKDSKGNWLVKVNLTPGKHEYKFFVDGNWWNDPQCTACVSNSYGGSNCVIDVK
jgi:1,4-alpha-glucan branching enzyme